MAQGGPKTADEIIQKISTCRQEIEKKLEKLAMLRPDMINKIKANAVDIEWNTPDSKPVITAKVVAVAAATVVSYPLTAAGVCAAGPFYKYIRRQGAKENAKNTLQLHEKETKVLLDKLKEWKTLVEDLKIIYPGVDSQVMETALLFLIEERKMSRHILDNIQNLLSCVALKFDGCWTVLKTIWEEGFDNAGGIFESLVQLCQSLFDLLGGWLTEKTEISVSLFTLAQKMEEAAATGNELHRKLKGLPAPNEVYTEKGMIYIIGKSRKFEWFSHWDAASEQFIKVLKFDNHNFFSLKTEDGQTKIGPADATFDVAPLQSLTINTEDEKKRALELVKVIMDVKKISPSQPDLIHLLTVVKSNNTQFNLVGLSSVIKEFQRRRDPNESFSKEMILAKILEF